MVMIDKLDNQPILLKSECVCVIACIHLYEHSVVAGPRTRSSRCTCGSGVRPTRLSRNKRAHMQRYWQDRLVQVAHPVGISSRYPPSACKSFQLGCSILVSTRPLMPLAALARIVFR